MKWHESIKGKLFGFFVLVSSLFLLLIVIGFTLFMERMAQKSAVEQARLNTTQIVNHLINRKNRVEEDVLFLASIVSEKYTAKKLNRDTIAFFMNALQNRQVVSGGVWFEPYMLDASREDGVLFFNKDTHGKFRLVKNYTHDNPHSYRKMEFYILGKWLKRGETFWTKVYRDPVTHVRMITVVSPLYEGEKFRGVASIDVEIGYYIGDIASREGSYAMLLDRSGTFVAKSPRVKRAVEAKSIYEIEDKNFSSLSVLLRQEIQKRKRNVGIRYRNEANALAKASFEISQNDAEMIVNIMHDKREHIEIGTHFLEEDPLLKEKSILACFYFTNTGMSLVVGMSKAWVLKDAYTVYRTILAIALFATLLSVIFGYILLKRYIIVPLERVNRQLHSSLGEDGHYRLLSCSDRGEIGELVSSLNTRTQALEEAQAREKEEIEKRLLNEKLLLQQSKMAAMGEMMDSVAHQWKQPLNALSMYSEIVKSDFEEGSVDQAYIETFSQNIQIQIDHMVDTLDEFRSFFRPNKKREKFGIGEIIDSVLFLSKDEFLKSRITVEVERKNEIYLYGSKNELKHLLLNIINNAKDAFDDNTIQEKRLVTIRVFDDAEGRRIEIEDNAGGIPEAVIADIFKANVTTKEEGKGTGIGLYMSRQIAEKYGATLTVKNVKRGACFTILFGTK